MYYRKERDLDTGAPPRKHDKRKAKINDVGPTLDEQLKNLTLAPGRHMCDCQAVKHELISNCLSCGRVVCQQEGSGPCLFCGTLVCSSEEREILRRQSKQSDRLLQKLMKVPTDVQETGLAEAERRKQQLLTFDRTSEQRTRVIDDQSDYFQVNKRDLDWMSSAERKVVKEMEVDDSERHASRFKRPVSVAIDMKTKSVAVVDDQKVQGEELNRSSGAIYNAARDAGRKSKSSSRQTKVDRDECDDLFRPTYIPNRRQRHLLSDSTQSARRPKGPSNRVQDNVDHLTTNANCRDSYTALAVRQPFASLLVAGIKRIELRSWPAELRGPVWIVAARHGPKSDVVDSAEFMYRSIGINSDGVSFPSSYPTGCVVGQITIEDCVTLAEFSTQPTDNYRHEELRGYCEQNSSTFVYIVGNAKQLVEPIEVQTIGHKFFPIDDGGLRKRLMFATWTDVNDR